MYTRLLGKNHPHKSLEVFSFRLGNLIYLTIDYIPWAYGDAWLKINLYDASDLEKSFIRFWNWYTPPVDSFFNY